jgi:Taurine catabolism dioxygenase TauD, TfdA family
MPTALHDAEVTWSRDLGRFLGETVTTITDRALLDDSYCDHLTRSFDDHADDLDGLTAAIHERLFRPPFFAVVRGLTFEPGDLLLAVLASRVGRLIEPYSDPRFAVIRRLTPAGASRAEGFGVLTEWLHTDSTNWPAPHDITLMLCERPDQNGEGASLVLPIDDAITEIEESLGPAAIDRLRTQRLPWAVDEGLGGGIVWEPVLSDSGIRWQLFRNVDAARRNGAACDPETLEFLREVDRAMRESDRLREFRLARNELLIINNRRTLHARRPVTRPERSERVLVHCKAVFRDRPYARPSGVARPDAR